MNDHIERTKRMIEVMQAYVDGEKIEARLDISWADWEKAEVPEWNFPNVYYRIAKTPDSINWDHVAPEFKYMKRNENDSPFFYVCHPDCQKNRSVYGGHFSSYRKGTVDWKESLVIRPGCE